jgi:3-methyl-2-oxobutanoate hydroxymethyltransferase
MDKRKKLTVAKLRKMRDNGEKIVMVTSYDACFAALAEAGNIDMILVGDSVGMTQLGYENTVPVTMDQMVHHCAAVRRGAPDTFIVGDMPFLSSEIRAPIIPFTVSPWKTSQRHCKSRQRHCKGIAEAFCGLSGALYGA